MVDITAPIDGSQLFIEDYRKGFFQIRGQPYEHPIILLPRHIMQWHPEDITSLTINDFGGFIQNHANNTELLIIGCGDRMVMPPSPLRQALKQHQIAIDFMDTGAACRTFNVLLGEGRKIAAALYPPTATK